MCFSRILLSGYKFGTMQQWLEEDFSDFWAPSSPDMNHLDYGVWSYVEIRSCAVPHPSYDALKTFAEKQWASMSKGRVVKVCAAFRPRLKPM
uniref:Uncharacterized protein n=1 Tax=Lepeophtheirus salmonis TaxID=72036 RepID=A0A0K2TNU5_LEPSM